VEAEEHVIEKRESFERAEEYLSRTVNYRSYANVQCSEVIFLPTEFVCTQKNPMVPMVYELLFEMMTTK
jgi:hypothetical protein